MCSSLHLPEAATGDTVLMLGVSVSGAMVTRGDTGVELVMAGRVAGTLVQAVLVKSSFVPLADHVILGSEGTLVEFCSRSP